jgi:hypothetical protein
MRGLVFVVVLGALACSPAARNASSPAASPTDGSGAPATLAARLDALCTGPSSVPMEIAGSREYVTVTLPGSKVSEPLRFHVDTGGNTPGLMLRRSVIARLGFASVDALPKTIRIGDRAVALPFGASWIVTDDGDDETRFDRAARKDFAAGQIGAGFLSRFVVCIDPGHARLGLGDPKAFDLDSAGPNDASVNADASKSEWVPLLLQSGGANHALYPFVHLLLREQGELAGGYGVLLDTGATTSMLDRNEIDYQRSHHRAWATANGAFGDADMIGGEWPEAVLSVPDVAIDTPGDSSAYGLTKRVAIDLGPARFVDRPTGTWGRMFGDVKATMGSHGAVANDVLLGYRLVLDYAHARLFVAPSPHERDASASSSRVGLAVRFGDDGCPVVRQITDTNAPEARSKIQVGDALLAVDGRDACAMWHHELQAALAGAPGVYKKLRLRRGAEATEIDVPTAELLGPSGSNAGAPAPPPAEPAPAPKAFTDAVSAGFRAIGAGDYAAADRAIDAAAAATRDELHLRDKVAYLRATRFAYSGDFDRAAASFVAILPELARHPESDDEFWAHNAMMMIRETQGDPAAALVENDQATLAAARGTWGTAEDRENLAYMKDRWHRAYLTRMLAESRTGATRAALVHYAEAALDDYRARARKLGENDESIAILEAYFAALDGHREVALAAAERVDVAKDDDLEDLYLVVVGLEAGGNHAGAQAVRERMRHSASVYLAHPIMLRWLEHDAKTPRDHVFTPWHAAP